MLIVALLVFVFTFALRAWGISTRFQLLGDQIRDWEIALQPLGHLPLIGPATHVHGYTLGPAFYWILWTIRVTLGPWFNNLPHAGGIGHAILHSGADALLLVAISRRFRSMWIALAAVTLEATAPFDLSLAAVIWNPMIGSMLAKVATALVLLDWHRRSTARAVVLFGVAWMAVHAYTGAIYVTVGVFGIAVVDALIAGDRKLLIRNVVAILAVVLALQLPYLAYQIGHPKQPAMAAVTGSVGDILSGRARLRLNDSVAGYLQAVNGIEIEPWHFGFTGLLLLVCGGIVAIRYWRDPAVLFVTVVPQAMAVVGYAFFLSGLDNYYYLSLMTGAVLTVVLALTAIPSARISRGMAMALAAAALAIVPVRRSHAMTINQMPEYGALVHGSRVVVGRGQPVRAIRTDFRLPPTNDPEFVYRILGGQIDPRSPWIAVIERSGDVLYRSAGPA